MDYHGAPVTSKHFLTPDYRRLRWREAFDFWRRANRLTYREIAAVAGVSVEALEKWRRPRGLGPRMAQLYALEDWRPGLVWLLFAPVLLASDRAAARLLRDRNYASRAGLGRRAPVPARELVAPASASLRLNDALADRLERATRADRRIARAGRQPP